MSSHKGIRLLIQEVALSLDVDMQFTYARTSDFNVLRDKRYPFIHLDPLVSVPFFAIENTRNYMKRWSAQMAFYQLDNEESDQTQYVPILDEMDDYVDKFINKLNSRAYGLNLDSDSIIISGMAQRWFIKETGDILTGWILTFQVEVSDQFNYCEIDC